jgi:hypothetical protein
MPDRMESEKKILYKIKEKINSIKVAFSKRRICHFSNEFVLVDKK